MIVEDKIKILYLGLCVYFCPPLFLKFARRWFPSEYSGEESGQHFGNAEVIRRRFWRAFMIIACVLGAVLSIQWWIQGGLGFHFGDWFRVLAVVLALTAALGRGGWSVQSWKGNTVVERIDRGMYTMGQLGAATLLVLVLTL